MSIYQVPWKLVQNKLVRYPGGRELDRFRGIYPGADDGRPEAWIGSDTRIRYLKDDPNEGCQKCILPDGREMYLFEAMELDPEAMLGKDHLAKHGKKMGVLAKLLDAQEQLLLQCHPTREYAKKWFNSDFGKAESWYIISMRDDTAEPPYVYLGFKEGITRADFEKGFYADDVHAMEACVNKIPVHVGDVYNIEPGAPHAIGPGCFLVEVQEPSDITVGWQRKTDGTPEENAYENERLLGCYNYSGQNFEENLKRFRIEPKKLRGGFWGEEDLMIGPDQTPYFSFTRLQASEPVDLAEAGDLQVGITIQGTARLESSDGDLMIKKADEFFLPASIGRTTVHPGPEGVTMVLCRPGK